MIRSRNLQASTISCNSIAATNLTVTTLNSETVLRTPVEVTQTGTLADDVVANHKDFIITLASIIDSSDYEGEGPNIRVLCDKVKESSIITARLFNIGDETQNITVKSKLKLDDPIDSSHNPGIVDQTDGEFTIACNLINPTAFVPKIRVVIQ